MCTLVALHGVVSRTRLLVAANRDEFFDRPAEGPALRATASGMLLAPRDVTAGGTWFGLNRFGVFAALTNVACPAPDTQRRSRGLLVVDMLNSESATQAAELLRGLPTHAYNPFNFFVADATDAFAFTYEDEVRGVPNSSGVFLVGNAPLDGPEPAKLGGLRKRIEAALDEPEADLLEQLGSWCGDHTSQGPRGPLDALCVHTPTYGTRSSCLLQLAADGLESDHSAFRFADGAPCDESYEDFTPLLRDLGRRRPGVQGVHVRSPR
jgi:uncharacterized protein with NRDE domain